MDGDYAWCCGVFHKSVVCFIYTSHWIYKHVTDIRHMMHLGHWYVYNTFYRHHSDWLCQYKGQALIIEIRDWLSLEPIYQLIEWQKKQSSHKFGQTVFILHIFLMVKEWIWDLEPDFFSQSSGSLQCQNCSMGRLRERKIPGRKFFLKQSLQTKCNNVK